MLSVSGKNWEEIKVNQRVIEKIKNDYNFSDKSKNISQSSTNLFKSNFNNEQKKIIDNSHYIPVSPVSQNNLIDNNTKVICQGFTGAHGTFPF